MKKAELSFLAVAAVLVPTPSAWVYSVGGPSGWQYRMPVHIEATKIDSNLTDFPVPVKLTSSNFDFYVRSDCCRIRLSPNLDGRRRLISATGGTSE